MANELLISVAMRYVNGTRKFETASLPFAGLFRTVTGTDLVFRTQTIAVSPGTAIDIGAIGTTGYAVFKNLDSTNFISIRNGVSGSNVVKLKAGDIALFRLATNSPYAVADTLACELLYAIIED